MSTDAIVEIMNEQVQRALGIDVDVYDVPSVENDIESERTKYVVASDTGDDIETTIASEGIPGEPVGVARAKRLHFEEFVGRYPEGTAELIATSPDISKSAFPVCDLGQWYVRPTYQNTGIGMRIGIELLSELDDLAQYPIAGGAWRKPDGDNSHIELYQRAGGTVLGEVSGPVPEFPSAPDGTDPEFDVVLFRGDIDDIVDYIGL